MAHRKKVALSVFSSVRLKKYYILLALFLILFVPAYDSAPSLPKKGSVPPNMLLKTWYEVAPYVELRYETWKNARGNENTVTITRFDLKHMQVRVQYQPSHPQSIQAWMQQENATAIINGGYFERDNTASALVISDGKRFGTSYRNLGGMLSVDTQGHTLLRSLSLHPYEPSEHLKQATQSFPMLLLSKGRRAQFRANASRDARSVVAMDTQGRLLFIASPHRAYSLDELADLLAASDLSLDTALNLDGGRSAGFALRTKDTHIVIEAEVQLPIVIVVKTGM